jgi:hypothetical protein
MSRRWQAQSADGIMQEIPGVGIISTWSTKTTPTNAANPAGYAPGCRWYFTPVNGPPKQYVNIGGNGMYVGNVQNTVANWIESDPTSGGQSQFGLSTGSLFGNTQATLYRTTLGATTSSTPAGISPSATGANKIVDVFTLPANAFDAIGRTLTFTVFANITAAVVGSLSIYANPSNVITWPVNPAVNGTNSGIASKTDGTITMTGGTLICSTAAQTMGAAGEMILQGQIVATGVSTQEACTTNVIFGAASGGTGGGVNNAWTDTTITSTAAIVFVIVAQIATAATDLIYNGCLIQGLN